MLRVCPSKHRTGSTGEATVDKPHRPHLADSAAFAYRDRAALGAEQLRFGRRELLVVEQALGVQVGELGQLGDHV